MSNDCDLIKKNIYLDKKIGEQSSQILLEGDIIVPDVKPDMASILQAYENIIIEKTELMQDKINFIGKLDINILYIDKSSDAQVYSINNLSNINDYINIDGITNEMFCDLKANINKIDYKILNDRKINFRAVIDIFAMVKKESEYEIIMGIENIPEEQLLKKNFVINRLIDNRCDRFIVKDELNISSGKPNIREILQTDINIMPREIKTSDGKIITNGELLLKILYKSDSQDSLIEFIEHELDFNGVFDVPKAKDFMFCDIKFFLQDKYIQVKPNEDGEDRIIDLEIFIGANIKLSSQEELEILDDAYCINKKLDITHELINYPNIISKNKMQASIKEIVQLENNCPDILQVLKINASAQIDDSHIINDKLIVEGIIQANILYIAKSDATPLYSFKTIIPYKQTIETRGALPDMQSNIDLNIDHINFNILSNKELELKIILSFNTYVIQDQELKIITQINFTDIDKNILENTPSMIVYITQEKDTLWDIAKKYNINPNKLIQINDLDNNNNLQPGQKLLIIKDIN